MLLADKIIKLRKQNGWSQEELAYKMNVSRQAVSKWEGAQNVPDLEKIVELSFLFGVTTDYLLKNDIEGEESLQKNLTTTTVKIITAEDANTYLKKRELASWRIAFATFLCMISPLALIILSAISEKDSSLISENVACFIGLAMLIALVLCAVPIFIYCGFENEKYFFLDKNIPFELNYDIKEKLLERKKLFRSKYVKSNVIATCVCIFSVVPLLISIIVENEVFCVIMFSITVIIAGVGVAIFIIVGVQNVSIQKLLQEGEFTKQIANKQKK